MTRRVLIVVNPHRPETLDAARLAAAELESHGIRAVDDVSEALNEGAEAALVLGGDGTMLHAAHLTRDSGIPLLGVNLGRVGFLAEIERDSVVHAIERLASRDYGTEQRGTLDVTVISPEGERSCGWALNEATIERSNLRTSLEVVLGVDGQPVTSFGCDGLVMSTPTGSTAHAFSAGGPVLWPDVKALLCVPLAAHALFARPLVIGPDSFYTVDVLNRSEAPGLVVLDGARTIDVPRGGRVDVRLGESTVTLARLTEAPFATRLVNKFSLPTHGWRGPDNVPEQSHLDTERPDPLSGS